MATEPRTHQLAASNVVSSGLTTLATVPPGARWLIKYICIVQYSGGPSSVGVWLEDAGDFSLIAGAAALASGVPLVLTELYGVLNAGQDLVIEFGAGGGGGLYFHVGGLIFDL